MGKGTIISGGTDGQYQVSVIYNTDRAAAEKAANLAKIANLEAQIAAETDEQKLNILKLQKLSLEKRNETLDAIPESKDVTAWCADLTEDLTGDVGLVEVPGESVAFNIQPGYNDNAAYDATRDGQLTPTLAMTPAAAFYNLAILPGWQKWKPTYRYGTITAISGDTADVTLDAATSTQQSLGVNQASTLADVPIEYMSCNGGVFEVGDEVLVKFTGQDWTSPVIVGFKANPVACNLVFTLTRGDGAAIDDTQDAYFVVKNSTGSSIVWGGSDEENITYDPVSGAWTITIPEWAKDPDGYYVWYNCTYGINTLYPGKYKTSEGVNESVPPVSSLIKPGVYNDTIPYWRTLAYEWVDAVTNNNIEGNECTLGLSGDIQQGQITLMSGGVTQNVNVVFIPAGMSATRRLSIASSVPYRISRSCYTSASDIEPNAEDHFYTNDRAYFDNTGVADCYSGPYCWPSSEFTWDGTSYVEARVTGGDLDLSIMVDNEFDESASYEYFSASIGGQNHEVIVEDTTTPDSVDYTCSEDSEAGLEGVTGTMDLRGIWINLSKCRILINANYDY